MLAWPTPSRKLNEFWCQCAQESGRLLQWQHFSDLTNEIHFFWAKVQRPTGTRIVRPVRRISHSKSSLMNNNPATPKVSETTREPKENWSGVRIYSVPQPFLMARSWKRDEIQSRQLAGRSGLTGLESSTVFFLLHYITIVERNQPIWELPKITDPSCATTKDCCR